jgi:hypothetical protein
MLQTTQLSGFGAGGAGGGVYVAAALALGSGTNFFSRGGSDSTAVDGTDLVLSFWFNVTGSDGANQEIIGGNVAKERIRVRKEGDNKWDVRLLTSDGSVVCDVHGTTAFSTSVNTGWHHFAFAMSSGGPQMYIDGSDDAAATTNNGGTIEFTDEDRFIGSGDGASRGHMDIAEIYINTDETLDLSSSDNMLKFRTAEGKPADLGADGSNPTGNQPNSYFRADADTPGNIVNNLGKGPNYSFTGTPAAASSSPSD